MKKVLAVIMALMMGVPSWASITVSPTRVEINANKIRNNYATSAIEVKGEVNRPVRYRVYTGFFDVNKDSVVTYDDDKTNPRNISTKVRFVPSEFTVPPGKSQKVRVNVANLNSLPDGESRAVIYLEDVEAKEYNTPQPNGITTQLILKTRVGIPIFVNKGNFTRKAEVDVFDIVKEKDGLYTNLKISSLGNAKVSYTGKIQIIDGKKLIDEYGIIPMTVYSGATKIMKEKIQTSKITASGEYTLRLILSYPDEKDNKKIIKKDTILKITGEKI